MDELHGIYGLRPPPAPPDSGWEWWWIAALAMLGGVALVLTMRRAAGLLTPRRRARFQLLGLQRRLARSRPAPDQVPTVARRVARILGRGLGLPHLGPRTDLPPQLQHHRERWQHYTRRLSAAGYGPLRPEAPDPVELIAEARYWLRKWP